MKSFHSVMCLSSPGATLFSVKNIQDFTLVAFCFNPFCNIYRDVTPATKLTVHTSPLKLIQLKDNNKKPVEDFKLQHTIYH